MKKVQYEEMLPHELEEAIKEFPVAYVPVGSLEWHGRHLARGTILSRLMYPGQNSTEVWWRCGTCNLLGPP